MSSSSSARAPRSRSASAAKPAPRSSGGSGSAQSTAPHDSTRVDVDGRTHSGQAVMAPELALVSSIPPPRSPCSGLARICPDPVAALQIAPRPQVVRATIGRSQPAPGGSSDPPQRRTHHRRWGSPPAADFIDRPNLPLVDQAGRRAGQAPPRGSSRRQRSPPEPGRSTGAGDRCGCERSLQSSTPMATSGPRCHLPRALVAPSDHRVLRLKPDKS